jgi:hypothetical protein
MFRISIFLLITAALYGDEIGVLTVPTSGLTGSGYAVDFQFIDGDGAGDGNNTVTLTDFSFGGGSFGAPSITNGVTVGSSPFSITMTDSSFFNDVQFAFTPGTSLSFRIDSTENPDTVAPDTFTVAILQDGNEIQTTNPNGFDSVFELDLPAPGSGLTEIESGSAPGSPVTIGTPALAAVPEPSSAELMAIVGAIAMVQIRRRRRDG